MSEPIRPDVLDSLEIAVVESQLQSQHSQYWELLISINQINQLIEKERQYKDFLKQKNAGKTEEDLKKDFEFIMTLLEIKQLREAAMERYLDENYYDIQQLQRQLEDIKQKIISKQIEAEKAEQERQQIAWIDNFNQQFLNPRIKQEFKTAFKITEAVLIAGRFIESVAINILRPIALGIEGATSAWEAYCAYRDKTLGQRKTRIGVGITNALAAGTAIAITFLLSANPIGIAAIAVGMLLMGLYRESYAVDQIRKQVAEAKQSIEEDREKIQTLLKSDPKKQLPETKLAIVRLQLKELKLNSLREKRFEAKRNVAFKVSYAIGAILMLVGVFVWPALVAGAIVLAATAVVDTIDKRKKFAISRAIGNSFSKAKIQPPKTLAPAQNKKYFQKKISPNDTAHVLEKMAKERAHADRITPAVIQDAQKMGKGIIQHLEQSTSSPQPTPAAISNNVATKISETKFEPEEKEDDSEHPNIR